MGLKSFDSIRNLYDLVQIPVVLKDRHHTVVYANKAYAAFLGRDVDTLVGTDGVAIYGAGAVDAFKRHDRDVMLAREEDEREFEIRARGGAIRRVRITKKRIDLGGQPYVFGIMTDLSYA